MPPPTSSPPYSPGLLLHAAVVLRSSSKHFARRGAVSWLALTLCTLALFYEAAAQTCALSSSTVSPTPCTDPEVITNITGAVYGNGAISCNSGSVVVPGSVTCLSTIAYQVFALACLNKRTCSVPTSSSVFMDPCGNSPLRRAAFSFTCGSGGPYFTPTLVGCPLSNLTSSCCNISNTCTNTTTNGACTTGGCAVGFSPSIAGSGKTVCLSSRCALVSNTDCSRCLQCVSGYAVATDGRCQLVPSINVTSPQFDKPNNCNGTLMQILPPGGAASVAVNWTTSARANSIFPNGTNASIRSVTCVDSASNNAPTDSYLSGGFTYVNCTAQDTYGLSSSCTFTVKVLDVTPPVATCPANQNVSTNAGTSSYTNTFTNAIFSATDNVISLAPTKSCNFSSSYAASLSGTPASYPIMCTATDRGGNTNNCTFSVVVSDLEAPVLGSCPSNFSGPQLPGTNYAFYNWTSLTPTATDAVNGLVPVICNYSWHNFSIGGTVVTCTARDAANNSRSCSFSVNIVDTIPPTVSCPANIIVLSLTTRNNITWSAPNATDNTAVVSTTLFNFQSNLCSGGGAFCQTTILDTNQDSLLLTFTAFDAAGLSSSCQWTITVQSPVDLVPPTFTTGCLNTTAIYSLVYNTDNGLSTATKSFSFTVTDNRPGTPQIASSPSIAGFQYPIGSTLVNVTATDVSNNTAWCAFNVIVVDAQPPTISNCLNNNSVALVAFTNTGLSTTVVSSPCGSSGACLQLVSASDNSGSVTSWYSAFLATAPNTQVNFTFPLAFPAGTSLVQFTAVDPFGNKAVCLQSVRIVDNEVPVINNCADVVVNTAPASALGTPPCPNIFASDNVNIFNTTITPPLVSGTNCGTSLGIGSTAFQVVTFDTSGNSANCSFNITVRDTEIPTITLCPNPAPLNTDFNRSSAVMSWAQPTATDNSGGLVNFTYSPAVFSGQRFEASAQGVAVTMTARDPSGNSAECSFLISVVDDQRPVISNCPSNSTFTHEYTINTVPGKSFGLFSVPALSAYDNVQLRSTQFSLPVSNGNFNLSVGTTAIAFTATDVFDLATVCTFNVIVVDNELPVIFGCPSNSTFTATFMVNNTRGQNTGNVSIPLITSTDNVPQGVIRQGSPNTFVPGFRSLILPVGLTPLQYLVTDAAGNPASCLLNAVVTDNEPPYFAFCPADFVAYTNATSSNIGPVTWTSPVPIDNVGVQLVNSSLLPGAYTLGGYNVTVRAYDAAGNIGICSFTFTMLMNQGSTNTNTGGSSSSSSSLPAIAGAGGAGGVVIILILVLVLLRRAQKKRLEQAQKGYAELLSMSDEYILERARNIQMTLMAQKQAQPPPSLEAHNARAERAFAPPPTAYDELIKYITETLSKGLDRKSLVLGTELGKGEFGAVNEGTFKVGGNDKKVAVKQLLSVATEDSRVRFLKEAAIMGQFDHPNIVQMIGVSVHPADQPILIVLEYMHLGSLQSYLQSSLIKDKLEQLTLLRMAIDVCAGMVYLSEAGFVHRDLAARNVLIDKEMTCRIGDFGLSIDLATVSQEQEGIYSGSEGARIPIRWTPIEAILYRHFSTASDVWSFGILMWEIWSYAEMPYKGWSNKKVTQMVQGGFRLPHPPGCPFDVYKLMIECWNKNPKARIPFTRLSPSLIDIWKQMTAAEPGLYGPSGEVRRRDSILDETGNLYDNQARGDPEDDDEEHSLKEMDGEDDVGGREDYGAVRETDLGGGKKKKKNQKAAQPASQLYDVGNAETDGQDGTSEEEDEEAAIGGRGGAGAGAGALYDVGGDVSDTLVRPQVKMAPRPSGVVSDLLQGKNRRRSSFGGQGMNTDNLGDKVRVHGVGDGRLTFIGPHHLDGEIYCGVNLDEPAGVSDGMFDGFRYFTCEPGYGVLIPVIFVQLCAEIETTTSEKDVAAAINPIGLLEKDETRAPPGYTQLDPKELPGAVPSGYLNVGAEDED